VDRKVTVGIGGKTIQYLAGRPEIATEWKYYYLLVFVFRGSAGEFQGQGENKPPKLVVPLDLGLNLRFVRDKKSTIKLLPFQPEKRKPWTNINFESLQGVNFRLFRSPFFLVSALKVTPLFWICVRHKNPSTFLNESVNP
jgi:hypothetical protein